MDKVRTMSSNDDMLDRLLVSFKDAKVLRFLFIGCSKWVQIALMEWSDAIHDLVTVSIHTYERAPQMVCTIFWWRHIPDFFRQSVLDSHLFRAELRADPLSRCAALTLPKDSLAILPFYQTQAEFDVMEQDQSIARYALTYPFNYTDAHHSHREVPYSPSFVLDLVADVDPNLRNVIDFVFLPGYNNPTIAVLCRSEKTWVG